VKVTTTHSVEFYKQDQPINGNNLRTEKSTFTNSSISISPEANQASLKMSNIAQKYDVNDLSQRERIFMTEELMHSGLIHSGVGVHLIAPTSMYEKLDDRSDFLTGMKESLKVDTAPLNSEHMKNKLKAINILEELKTLKVTT